MKFVVSRNAITVEPESDLDVAYIEDTLGLRNAGDAIALVRRDAYASSNITHLTTNPFPVGPIHIVVPRGSNVEEQ